jgi:hypothetical protein
MANRSHRTWRNRSALSALSTQSPATRRRECAPPTPRSWSATRAAVRARRGQSSSPSPASTPQPATHHTSPPGRSPHPLRNRQPANACSRTACTRPPSTAPTSPRCGTRPPESGCRWEGVDRSASPPHAAALASQLGTPLVEFPGDHGASPATQSHSRKHCTEHSPRPISTAAASQSRPPVTERDCPGR